MVKRDKSQAPIPESLIPAFEDLFPDYDTIPILSRNTHERRMTIINNGEYIDEEKFNDRYKKEDVKIALNNLYKNKCAFCEQKVEQSNVEHYRPKKIYYWLAFSWDNLVMACPSCNQYKGINFELHGERVHFDITEENIRNINTLSGNYDEIELPKMINPEIIDPINKITFTRNGVIRSQDPDFAYTIEKCKIDRKFLNDERKRLIDVYERDIRSALVENSDPISQQNEISAIIRKFVRDSSDEELEFLAFRRFAISSRWLNMIVKELN